MYLRAERDVNHAMLMPGPDIVVLLRPLGNFTEIHVKANTFSSIRRSPDHGLR